MSSHNPYFNRWFSAIEKMVRDAEWRHGHNPYFNRWFSAIRIRVKRNMFIDGSQSLF